MSELAVSNQFIAAVRNALNDGPQMLDDFDVVTDVIINVMVSEKSTMNPSNVARVAARLGAVAAFFHERSDVLVAKCMENSEFRLAYALAKTADQVAECVPADGGAP